MGIEFGSHDRHDRMLREWLLLLLRFAITREPPDQSAALAMADELDSLGTRWRPAAPLFFLTATNEVSTAILAIDDGQSRAVLRKHLARIDDPRLRQAFQAAVGLQSASETPQQHEIGKRKKNFDLWKGLQRR
jgi:hypothetical protein